MEAAVRDTARGGPKRAEPDPDRKAQRGKHAIRICSTVGEQQSTRAEHVGRARPSTWTEPVGRSRAGPSGAERRRAGPSGAESRGTARVTARRLRESRLAEALGVGGGEAALEVL